MYLRAHATLRDDMEEWRQQLLALMDTSRAAAADFLAAFVEKVCPGARPAAS